LFSKLPQGFVNDRARVLVQSLFWARSHGTNSFIHPSEGSGVFESVFFNTWYTHLHIWAAELPGWLWSPLCCSIDIIPWYIIYGCSHCCDLAASYPGLLNLAFVACIANMGEGLVKLITCNDVPGRLVDVWRSGTFPEKLQTSELLITNMEWLSAWHQAVLAMFHGFRKLLYSCTEEMCHSSTWSPNVHVCHCTWSVLPGLLVASYPGLLAPAFVACSTNTGEGLVKLSRAVMYLDVWRSGTFPEKQQVSECATDRKHRP